MGKTARDLIDNGGPDGWPGTAAEFYQMCTADDLVKILLGDVYAHPWSKYYLTCGEHTRLILREVARRRDAEWRRAFCPGSTGAGVEALGPRGPEEVETYIREAEKFAVEMDRAVRDEASLQERIDEEGAAPVFVVLKVDLWREMEDV